MSITPIPSTGFITGLPQTGGLPAAKALPGGDQASFGSLVNDMLQQANQQQLQADASIGDLVTGQTENVDDVVLSVVKADLAFRMVLEIRNRLMQSYQEVMRMQI